MVRQSKRRRIPEKHSLGNVTKPSTNFKNITGTKSDLEIHSNNFYRQNAMSAGKYFLKNDHNPKLQTHNLPEENRLSQIEENRKIPIPIIKTILFLGYAEYRITWP